jgi:hypothetical protein
MTFQEVDFMKLSVSDRRLVPRVPIDFDIKYRILKGKRIENIDETGYRNAKASNVSIFGIAINTVDPLEEGDILHANFTIEGREIDAFCAVAWSEFSCEKKDYEVGLEFDFLGQYDCIYLIQFIKRTLEKGSV